MSPKFKAIFSLVAMFILGAVTDTLWRTCRDHSQQSWFRGQRLERRIQKLKRELNLSPEQEVAVRNILTKARDQAKQVNEEVSWDLADIHRGSVQAIRQVLTPEQIEQFEKLHEHYHARHKHMPSDDLKARGMGNPK